MVSEDIIKKAACGDNNAFTQLYSETNKIARAVICKYCDDSYEVEDLLQDTYIEVYKYLKDLQDYRKLQAWINRIAANKAIRYLKKVKPNVFSDLETEDGTDPVDLIVDERAEIDPFAAFDKQNIIKAVNTVLNRLPEAQRNTLNLVYGQGYKIGEVAEMYGISENTVKTWLHRGSQKMEKYKAELQRMGVSIGGIAIAFLVYEAFCTDVAYAAGVSPEVLFMATAEDVTASAAEAASAEAAAVNSGSASAGGVSLSSASAGGAAAAAGTAASGIGAKIAIGILSAVILVGGSLAATIIVRETKNRENESTEGYQTEYSEETDTAVSPAGPEGKIAELRNTLDIREQLEYFLNADLKDEAVFAELEEFTRSESAQLFINETGQKAIWYPAKTGGNVLKLTNNGVYRGEADKGVQTGQGFTKKFGEKKYYEGNWENDAASGYGTLYTRLDDGTAVVMSGNFVNGFANGTFKVYVSAIDKTLDASYDYGVPQEVAGSFNLFDFMYYDYIVIAICTLDNGQPYKLRVPKDHVLEVRAITE